MENIVLITDVGDCVAKTIRGICEGVLKARAEGINAELPEDGEIDFKMVIVKDYQNLEIKRVENGTQNESQGGKTTETQGGKTTEKQGGETNETTNVIEKGTQDGGQVSGETNIKGETSTRAETSQELAENAHNQTTTNNLTYE